MFDLSAAAADMKRLVVDVRDDQLDYPTPCSEWRVTDLLTHIHQFAFVFAHNARKQQARPPGELVGNWRESVPEQLDDLAQAWSRTSAWHGRVSAGGIEMDAADNAVVAIEELTVHAWDLARATGQELRVDDARLGRVDDFFERFGAQPFGPAVPVADDTARLERIIARTGRDPWWTQSRVDSRPPR